MCKNIYTEILRGSYKVLGHWADELIETDSDFDFFRYIATYIAPLIRKSSNYERIYFRWMQEKDVHLKIKYEHQQIAPQEVISTLNGLKVDIENNNLLKDPKAKQKLDDIQKIFEEKSRYAIPSYVDVAYDQIIQLLEYLFDIGKLDLVSKYSTIAHHKRVIFNQETRKNEIGEKPYILQFIFAPSLVKLHEIERQDNIEHAWQAWEFIALVEWCWNTPFSFFNNKHLSYNDLQNQRESAFLLTLHHHWLAIDRIKKCAYQNTLLFQRDHFLRHVTLVLNEIILDQEINSAPSIDTVISPFIAELYNVKLKFEYAKLWLDVVWFENGETHTYIIHSFQDDSGLYYFMKTLNDAPLNEKVDIREVSGTTGGSVIKYFGWMKINNILGRLFFTKIKDKTYCAAMKTKVIQGKNLSSEDRAELIKHIKTLNEYRPQLTSRDLLNPVQ